jgi:hypothetical protein
MPHRPGELSRHPAATTPSRMGLTRLVNQLVSEGSVIAIRVLDKSMITVDYAERLRDDKLPEPTEAELADILSLAKAGRTQSFLERSFLKVVAPIGDEGGELKGERSWSLCPQITCRLYSQPDSAGDGRQRPGAFARVGRLRFWR